ncbi:hypothetical protein [Lactiplantibacillus pentosus]|uniref:hypothetical protein n=1 Tax=Lactiplantibacillus pentosus TaxID=1589 RepID=UPI0015980EB5|nr:hypothetical protein [Lactiplantibacillus pentosus]BBM22857.1 prophage P1 protein 35 [Lactiplantibacillus plantarum]
MEIVQILLFWRFGLFIYLVSLFTSLQPADWNGWLGFFGSLLGSIIAILGVYWQVSVQAKKAKEDAEKQQNLLREQLDNEKENQYRQARPFFLVYEEEIDYIKELSTSIGQKAISEGKDLLDEVCFGDHSLGFHLYISDKADSDSVEGPQHYLIINNVSTKNMYAVKVFVTKKYDNGFEELDDSSYKEYDTISINKIGAGEKVLLLFGNNNEAINQVSIWYITEIRESIKLYFRDKGSGLVYESKYKRLENQQESSIRKQASYDLTGFKESTKLK